MFRSGVLELVCQERPALDGKAQGCDQLFVQSAFLAANIPEALAPVPGRWRVVVLRAERQCTDYSVQQVALVGVVAVDAQATPAQSGNHLVQVDFFVLQHDVEFWFLWGVDGQAELCAFRKAGADLLQRIARSFVEAVQCGHTNTSPTVHRQADKLLNIKKCTLHRIGNKRVGSCRLLCSAMLSKKWSRLGFLCFKKESSNEQE